MELLELAQIIFYLTFSLFLAILGILFSVAVYYMIRFVMCLYKISENIENATEEMKENINEIFDRLAELPILSFFMKKRRAKKSIKKNK